MNPFADVAARLIDLKSRRSSPSGESDLKSHEPIKPVPYNSTVPEFVVIAHRGASAYSPENTMSAFKKAAELKSDFIELDVLLTRDGVPVILHDPELKRTTNIAGIISELTVDEALKADAGSWFSRKFEGEKIPMLEDVLEWAKDTIALNIEIKPEAVGEHFEDGVEDKVIRLVKKQGMEKRVILSSFDPRAVERVKKECPEIPAAVLYSGKGSGWKTPLEMVEMAGADGCNMNRRWANKQWVRELRGAGLPVWIYTVDSEREMRRLIKMGVTGIFSNRPDLLRKVALEELGTGATSTQKN